jgi:hypothetical protein
VRKKVNTAHHEGLWSPHFTFKTTLEYSCHDDYFTDEKAAAQKGYQPVRLGFELPLAFFLSHV